jgi:hypothetical protein
VTAISLFDNLGPQEQRIGQLAAQLVESALADWNQLRQYESDFTPFDWSDAAAAMSIEQSIYALHQQWAEEAEQVVCRAKKLSGAGHDVPKTGLLEDALWLTRARLQMTPQEMARAMEQVKQGQCTPAKELRDELRARLRP